MWGEVTFSVGEGWEGRYPSCWLGICQSLKTPPQWNMELCWCSKRKQWKGILDAWRENIGSIRNWTLLQNYFHAFWLLSTLHPNCCFHPSNIRILNLQNISSLNCFFNIFSWFSVQSWRKNELQPAWVIFQEMFNVIKLLSVGIFSFWDEKITFCTLEQ